VSVHFARISVTKIDLSKDANSQFQLEAMVAAAQLLADAEVDVIGWSGTSAGWLGFEKDETLCQHIRDVVKIPFTTSTLALNDLLGLIKGENLGLVTPYISAVNEKIRTNYSNIGFNIPIQRLRSLNMTRNADFALVTESQLDPMVAGIVQEGADVIAVFCTNLQAAQRVAYWEELHGIVVLDSVATAVWGMLRLISVDLTCIKGWGAIFDIR
jgi:maleate isomerase